MATADLVSIIGTIVGFIGIVVSIYLFHHQINKLLVKIYDTVQYLAQQMQIFNDRSGVVTYEQAVEIVDMYLVGIEYNLRSHALSYCPHLGGLKPPPSGGSFSASQVKLGA